MLSLQQLQLPMRRLHYSRRWSQVLIGRLGFQLLYDLGLAVRANFHLQMSGSVSSGFPFKMQVSLRYFMVKLIFKGFPLINPHSSSPTSLRERLCCQHLYLAQRTYRRPLNYQYHELAFVSSKRTFYLSPLPF